MEISKKETELKKSSSKTDNSGKYPKPRCGVYGVEMIEKEVKPRGNTGRIYLPADWVGKVVKIIRID